jgi:hypothetical protein
MGWFLGALTIGVSLHKYWLDSYNNYRIFARSLKVLLAHENLYVAHPEYYHDLFKYSPTFPLLMAPFSWQPDVTGLVCWNLLNAFALFAAVRAVLPESRQAVVALAVLLLELVISLQSSQSNGLTAALMLYAFAQLEHGRPCRAALFMVGGFFLKVYGLAIAVLAFLYRDRGRLVACGAVWFVAFAAAPWRFCRQAS